MKISINEGYNAGEDTLVYSGSIGNIVGNWYNLQGYLILRGDASTTADNYRDAIKSVKYMNNKLIPTLGKRKITITLEDADYFPGTGHFYRFEKNLGIKWTDAEVEAKSDKMKYYGLRGYLATITSMFENSFIQSKTTGLGWIGASDAAKEGEWRWVTGPEGLNGGLLFWKGSGYQAKMNNPAGVYGPVNGAYHNWNRWDKGFSSSLDILTWEPNDYKTSADHEEDYAHITFNATNPGESLKWNDYPNDGGSAGYLIEFGGTEGDPVVYLSATLSLQVNTLLFNTGTINPICEGLSVTLNQPDANTPVATYTWTPTTGLSDPTIANPVANPIITTEYTVIGTRGKCVSQPTIFKVSVNPKPVSTLPSSYDICKGDQKVLDPGVNSLYTYKWGSGETSPTISVSAAGDYSVTLTTDKNCSAPPFTSKVIVHDYPTIDLSYVQKLICGDAKTTIADIKTNASDYTLQSVDNRAQISNKSDVAVADFGIYPMKVTANHAFCPSHEDFNLEFRGNPKGNLTVNGQTAGQKCFGYNLDAVFTPDGDLSGANYDWEFGGAIIANGIDLKTQVVPLGTSLLKRELKLTVTRDGCSYPFVQNILVSPKLNLTAKFFDGCQPLEVEFTATSEGAVTYDWIFENNIVINGFTPVQKHTYLIPASYALKLKVTTIDGCSNEATIPNMVNVHPIPDVKFSLSPADCLEPGVHELAYAGLIGTPNDTYSWDLSNLDPSEISANPGITQGPLRFDLKTKPKATIGLNVLSSFGCRSLPGSISLKRKPDFTISASSLAGCIPFTPTLSGVIIATDTKDEVDFTWDFGDGSPTATGTSVSPIYDLPGKNYTVTMTGKSSITGCSNFTTNDLLKTFSQPKAAFNMDHKVVYNDKPEVKFTDISTGNPATWLWDFGDGVASVLQNPTYHFVKTGSQRVTLEVSNTDGCTDGISDTVLVAFDRLFPPNGFSPNAPNRIDQVFLLNSEGITPEGYHFRVLSRWNDIVFEAKGEIKGWDGRMLNGTFAPAGAYVWILNFSDFLGRKHQQTGTVTLIY